MAQARRRIGTRTLLAFLLISLAVSIAARYLSSSEPRLVEVSRRSSVLGTYATYIVIADSISTLLILDSMDSLASHLDDQLGFFGSGELSEINTGGFALMSGMSDDMERLLRISLAVSSITDSLFDPVMGALVRTWGFPSSPRVPDSAEVDSALAVSGLANLSLSGDTLSLENGALLDLGAIAKGFVVDRLYMHAGELGASAVLVEIGGEIRCGGDPGTGRVWRVGVRDPRGRGLTEVLEMKEGAVATSGDYETYIIQEDDRFCHILDPRTGYPQTVTVSVTVVADEAVLADALATAVSVGGTTLAETLPDSLFRMIIVSTDDGRGGTVQWRRRSE